MLVRLIWHIDENNKYEKIVTVPNNTSKTQIQNMFYKYIGVEYNKEECEWEALKDDE